MKIVQDPTGQCLLCIGYDFKNDSPLQREVARNRRRPAVDRKSSWRYASGHLGLRTFLAYEGPRPVGHIECMPLEHAPLPVRGENMMALLCLSVAKAGRGKGAGKALLAAAEEVGAASSQAMVVIASAEGRFIPADFFEHQGYTRVSERKGEVLLYKAFGECAAPDWIPPQVRGRPRWDSVYVRYFLRPQCPMSSWTLERLRREIKPWEKIISLEVVSIENHADAEKWGLNHGMYIDGEPVGSFPPHPAALLEELRSVLAERNLAAV